jgi:hypothetical protein
MILDAGQIMDDLIPICFPEENVLIGNARSSMLDKAKIVIPVPPKREESTYILDLCQNVYWIPAFAGITFY